MIPLARIAGATPTDRRRPLWISPPYKPVVRQYLAYESVSREGVCAESRSGSSASHTGSARADPVCPHFAHWYLPGSEYLDALVGRSLIANVA